MKIAEDGGTNVVVFPQIVVNHLEMPDAFPVPGVERNERVGVEIRARPPSPVRRRGRRRQRDVDVTQLLVG